MHHSLIRKLPYLHDQPSPWSNIAISWITLTLQNTKMILLEFLLIYFHEIWWVPRHFATAITPTEMRGRTVTQYVRNKLYSNRLFAQFVQEKVERVIVGSKQSKIGQGNSRKKKIWGSISRYSWKCKQCVHAI